MPRRKQHRIDEAVTFKNILQPDDPQGLEKVTEFIGDSQQVFLELGCGKGEYTLGLSKMFPNAKCIGVDIQGERIWNGAKKALEEKNENILFLRIPIEKITEFLPKHSVSEIWIPFPDPFPKEKKAKRRLTSPRFLKLYKEIIKKDGSIHLKTDNENLFLYTQEVLESLNITTLEINPNVYKKEPDNSTLFIQTTYEKRYLKEGKKIFYIRFLL